MNQSRLQRPPGRLTAGRTWRRGSRTEGGEPADPRLGRGREDAGPRGHAGHVIVGAAEVMLLSGDPHLAARAAWLLLRER
ncbi:MAG: hypothetical protein ACYDHN_15870 [Solirubrobacteraceae bacterium]